MTNFEIYSNKLVETYQLEMFYGDETLQALIDHSRNLVNRTIDFQEKYYDAEVGELSEEEEEIYEEAPAAEDEE